MKRIATALVGIPLTVVLSLKAPNWLFALVVAVVAAASLEELLSLANARIGARPGRWALLLGFLVTFAFSGGIFWALTAVTGAMLLSSAIITFSVSLEEALAKIAMAIMGIIYCCVLAGFIVLLPPELRVVVLAVVWVGDAAAFYGGRALGKHFLAPKISPKKTVEGAFAGLIASMIAGVLLGVLITNESPGVLLAASFLAASAGQVGDLAESAMKRSAGVKDSSAVLPGHGGMLDRIDSLLFAAPVFYWFFGT
jgi:phosphatidate cytidylyltransferase